MTKFHIFGPPQYPLSDATILFPLWVFAHKIDGDGEIVDEKAHLVVNGGKQVKGKDYYETFTAVLHFESLHILIALWVR